MAAPNPAPIAVAKPPPPKPTSLTILVENRLINNDPAAEATVTITGSGAPLTDKTGKFGSVTIKTTGLANGKYKLQVVPKDTSSDPVGPDLAETAAPPKRIFRGLDAEITLEGGLVTSAFTVPGELRGLVERRATNNLVVKLQPVWMQSPNFVSRSGDVSLIVIHHTGDGVTKSLNTFMAPKSASANYVLDTDGQLIKLVADSRAAQHAGKSHWLGQSSLSGHSIGIEIVHSSGAYPEAQYTALLELLERLVKAHPTITRDQIVGHSDVGTHASGSGVLGRKGGDPGLEFDWPRLEAEKLGLQPKAAPVGEIYGGFFTLVPKGFFQPGDSDAKGVYGGKPKPAKPGTTWVTGTPLADLQTDLQTIGYSVNATGAYDEQTAKGVQMFQQHFFAGSRKGAGLTDGRADKATAEMIQRVRP